MIELISQEVAVPAKSINGSYHKDRIIFTISLCQNHNPSRVIERLQKIGIKDVEKISLTEQQSKFKAKLKFVIGESLWSDSNKFIPYKEMPPALIRDFETTHPIIFKYTFPWGLSYCWSIIRKRKTHPYGDLFQLTLLEGDDYLFSDLRSLVEPTESGNLLHVHSLSFRDENGRQSYKCRALDERLKTIDREDYENLVETAEYPIRLLLKALEKYTWEEIVAANP